MFSCLFTRCHTLYATCYTELLCFSRYCTVRLKLFYLCVCLFFMYYLCEKYYKSIAVQHYIANCVSWEPRLTLLYLWTNWAYEHTLRMKLVHWYGTCCISCLKKKKHIEYQLMQKMYLAKFNTHSWFLKNYFKKLEIEGTFST